MHRLYYYKTRLDGMHQRIPRCHLQPNYLCQVPLKAVEARCHSSSNVYHSDIHHNQRIVLKNYVKIGQGKNLRPDSGNKPDPERSS